MKRANLKTVKDAQMDGSIVKTGQEHIDRITGIPALRVEDGIDRGPGTEDIVAVKGLNCMNNPHVYMRTKCERTSKMDYRTKERSKSTHSSPVEDKVLSFGSALSISNSASSLGKSAFSIASFESCVSEESSSSIVRLPSASWRLFSADLLSVKFTP